MRLVLLDAVVKPALLWDLESMNLTRIEQRSRTAVQRTMTKWILAIPKRPGVSCEDVYRRRERVAEDHSVKAMRCKWGRPSDTVI